MNANRLDSLALRAQADQQSQREADAAERVDSSGRLAREQMAREEEALEREDRARDAADLEREGW